MKSPNLNDRFIQQVHAETSDAHQAPSPAPVQGLPVAGYAATQEQWRVDLVNTNKVLEEVVLQQIDWMSRLEATEVRTESRGHYGDHDYPVQVPACDGRQLSLARTKLEEAFYHINRAVFQPKRLTGEPREIATSILDFAEGKTTPKGQPK